MQNNQGLSKGFGPQPLALAQAHNTSTPPTSTNNCLQLTVYTG